MSSMTDYTENELAKAEFRSHGIVPWAASTAFSLGARIYATNVSGPFVFECTTAGTSAAAQPTFNTGLGATTVDGTVTWTCYHVGTLKRPIFVALLTASPTEAGALTEVTGGGYARAQLDPSDANWSAPVSGNGLVENAAVITFPTPTGNWSGPITHLAIVDRATGGNPRYIGALTNAKTVNNGDPAPTFPIGSFDITFA